MMKSINRYRAIRALTLVVVLFSAGAYADIILEPDPVGTVHGSVGLANEAFSNGSVYSSSSGTSSYNASFGSDGQFNVTTGAAGNTFALQVYMYNFQNTQNAQLRQYIYNQPGLTPDETRSLDLRRGSGRIAATVAVTGGSLSRLSVQTVSTDDSVPEQFYGNVTVSAPPYIATVPVPPLAQTRVYGTATIATQSGCSTAVTLADQYIDVQADTDNAVSWAVDVSGADCTTGTLQGQVSVSGLDGDNTDAIETSKRISVYGPEYRNQYLYNGDTAYLFSDLTAGAYNLYSYVYFNAPYYYFYKYSPVTVEAGAVTPYDEDISVGTVHGSLDLTGPWNLGNVRDSTVLFQGTQSYGHDQPSVDTGAFDLVLPDGDSYLTYLFFRNYGTDPDTGDYEYWSVSHNPYGESRTNVSLAEGERLDIGAHGLVTSQAYQPFQVAQVDGQPEAQVNRLVLSGYSHEYHPDTNALIAQNNVYTDFRAALPTSSPGVLLRGLPGSYQMQATGYGTDGRIYRANFQLELGYPDATPVGTDVEQTFTSESGDSIGSLTFDNVTQGGETTLSQTTLGPGAPKSFKVYKAGGQPQYFDITTTAVFEGTVTVCFNYDDSNISDPDNESKLELGHYIDETGTWDIITLDGSPDTVNNVICGSTSSFSLFALLEVDIVDADGDGILDDTDNCPNTPNESQSDLDQDGIGDACDTDTDGDGIPDDSDLCPTLNSTDNYDLDGDGIGDPCDPDVDGDGNANESDNCPVIPNPDQDDFDTDGDGDQCDTDDDNDTVLDVNDDCPGTITGITIDPDGCSSEQRIEAVCPVGGIYRNHGQYVSCVAKEAKYQVDLGIISEEQKGAIVSTAAKSSIGNK